MENIMEYDLLDDDGYPTESALNNIATFDYLKPIEFFEFIKSIWWTKEMLWNEYDDTDILGNKIRVFEMSTGGWSGNEDIIRAMQKNIVLWMYAWYSSRRGGHYIFQIKIKE